MLYVATRLGCVGFFLAVFLSTRYPADDGSCAKQIRLAQVFLFSSVDFLRTILNDTVSNPVHQCMAERACANGRVRSGHRKIVRTRATVATTRVPCPQQPLQVC